MKTQLREIEQIWNRILEDIKNKLIARNEKRIFDSFLSDSKIIKIEGNIISVQVNSKLAKQLLSTTYQSLITQTIEECLESNFTVSFLTQDEINSPKKEEPSKNLFYNSNLKPDMTFDSFVQGESNKEAYQAAVLVATDSLKSWSPNPLYIFSDSGLGKTHLLNAIGNAIKENSPNKQILIITAEKFFNEFIHFANGNRLDEQMFDYFRDIDVLLIDDIQFFSGKEACQQGFFTIFSSLINDNKKVVITSDKHPNELKGIENRLISRFVGGLTVSIMPPEKATSIEIIKRYVVASGIDINRIDEDVFSFFAEKFSKNIRELKGAINKLLFYTINVKKVDRITLSNAIEAVSDFLKANEVNKKLTEIRIIDVVSNYYSLTPSQVTGNIRTNQIALARHISMYLIRDLLDLPLIKIGEVFGGKDHSTVISAVKKVEKELKTNPSLQTVIKEIKERLK